MIKLTWTCTKCGIWSSIPKEHLVIADSISQLVCRLCGHNSTDELIAGDPVHHLTSTPMIPDPQIQPAGKTKPA